MAGLYLLSRYTVKATGFPHGAQPATCLRSLLCFHRPGPSEATTAAAAVRGKHWTGASGVRRLATGNRCRLVRMWIIGHRCQKPMSILTVIRPCLSSTLDCAAIVGRHSGSVFDRVLLRSHRSGAPFLFRRSTDLERAERGPITTVRGALPESSHIVVHRQKNPKLLGRQTRVSQIMSSQGDADGRCSTEASDSSLQGDVFFLDGFAQRQWDDPGYSGTRMR